MVAYPVNVCIINTDFDPANWYGTKMSPYTHHVPRAKPQHYVINPTNLRSTLDDSVEHRLHVGGRAADDAEHLGGRGLMLEGFTQFCVAFLDLFEEPSILDGNDSLSSECF